MAAALLAFIVGIPSYAMFIQLGSPSVWLAMVPAVVAGAAIVAPWAVVTSYLSERFKTSNRAVEFGLGYSLAVIIPAFYAPYQQRLANLKPASSALVRADIRAALTGVEQHSARARKTSTSPPGCKHEGTPTVLRRPA